MNQVNFTDKCFKRRVSCCTPEKIEEGNRYTVIGNPDIKSGKMSGNIEPVPVRTRKKVQADIRI